MFTSLESADGRTRAAAWWPWALLYALVVVYILGGSERSVTPLYFEAAEHWLKGEDLYISLGQVEEPASTADVEVFPLEPVFPFVLRSSGTLAQGGRPLHQRWTRVPLPAPGCHSGAPFSPDAAVSGGIPVAAHDDRRLCAGSSPSLPTCVPAAWLESVRPRFVRGGAARVVERAERPIDIDHRRADDAGGSRYHAAEILAGRGAACFRSRR